MLAILIAFDGLCLHLKINESINDRADFVIVVVGRYTSFYRIYDWQIVPALDIS